MIKLIVGKIDLAGKKRCELVLNRKSLSGTIYHHTTRKHVILTDLFQGRRTKKWYQDEVVRFSLSPWLPTEIDRETAEMYQRIADLDALVFKAIFSSRVKIAVVVIGGHVVTFSGDVATLKV